MKDLRLMRQELLGSTGDPMRLTGAGRERWAEDWPSFGNAAVQSGRFEALGTFVWEIDPLRFRPRAAGRRGQPAELTDRLWRTLETHLQEIADCGAEILDTVHELQDCGLIGLRILRTSDGFEVAARVDARGRVRLSGAWEQMRGTLAGAMIRFRPL